MRKLIDDESKEINFEDKEKKIPILNFLLEFLAWVNISRKNQKTREQHIEDVLVDLAKYLANCQLLVKKEDKTIQKNVRRLKLTKQEYQKLFQENKLLKEKNILDWKRKICKKNCKNQAI